MLDEDVLGSGRNAAFLPSAKIREQKDVVVAIHHFVVSDKKQKPFLSDGKISNVANCVHQFAQQDDKFVARRRCRHLTEKRLDASLLSLEPGTTRSYRDEQGVTRTVVEKDVDGISVLHIFSTKYCLRVEGTSQEMLMNSAYSACALMAALSFSGLLVESFGKMEYVFLTVAAAAMAADAFFHMLPEAHDHGLEAFCGAFSVVLLEHASFAFGVEPFGIANLAVEAVHNFVDGVALGATFSTSKESGFAATLAIAAHELPQELGDFVVLKRAGFRTRTLLLANFAVSLTSFAGVALAEKIGESEPLLAFTGGSFIALSLHSITPQAVSSMNEHKASVFSKLGCVAIAVAIAAIFSEHDHDHH